MNREPLRKSKIEARNSPCTLFGRKPESLAGHTSRLGFRVSNFQFRVSNKAFTLVELIAAITILLLLTTMALPLARNQLRRAKEIELREDLRRMREAVDQYKLASDRGLIPVKADTFGYPPDLQTLVDGVVVRGTAKGKYKFLRKIPVDPMTGNADWGLRSMQDDPDSKSWGRENVFDVYSRSEGTALDGTRYGDW